jgi:ATP-dependent DNA helicase RecG
MAKLLLFRHSTHGAWLNVRRQLSQFMRPALLNPLFAPLRALPGVGPKTGKLFDRLLAQGPEEARVLDALFHLPHSTIDRRSRPRIAEAERDIIVTIEVKVTEHRPPPGRNARGPYRVLVEDETGDMLLVFFKANHDWIERMLPLGAKRWVSGRLELWEGHLQMVHPDRVLDEEGLKKLPPVEPVYGLTEGLYQRNVQKAVDAGMERTPALPDWLDPAYGRARKWPAFLDALRAIHHPQKPEDIDPRAPARQRLAFDELLANQLALVMVRARMKKLGGRATISQGVLAQKIADALPFTLTGAQSSAIGDIVQDLASEERMLRLVQGDVGSGKTLVALMAMAHVVEAGRQASMMAPTEILARQHYERLQPLCAAAGIRLGLLTGRDKAAERNRTLAALIAGEIDIVVGTHALFQESVAFRDLALAVVDEQHRFGVHQRLALGDKGEAVDILVMTATPIPRTLVLTYFGDMDVSVLREKPAGRAPIDTRAIPIERLEDVVHGLSRALASGARIYWVCPLVEENEDLDLAAAGERFELLQQFFGDRVGLVHGQMKGREKDAAMEAFQRGETQILVATTVIEVGVDVPEASIMVIEHAERFGLAQLHQLRGRVGRGSAKSSCLLLYKSPLGEVARARLEIMRETEDGFRIAEEDLRLRGEGEVLGSKQSGAPGFRLALLEFHAELLAAARDDAQLIFGRDPELQSQRGQALRTLLYLFGRDEAARLLQAG